MADLWSLSINVISYLWLSIAKFSVIPISSLLHSWSIDYFFLKIYFFASPSSRKMQINLWPLIVSGKFNNYRTSTVPGLVHACLSNVNSKIALIVVATLPYASESVPMYDVIYDDPFWPFKPDPGDVDVYYKRDTAWMLNTVAATPSTSSAAFLAQASSTMPPIFQGRYRLSIEDTGDKGKGKKLEV